jgi:hypothetical protein
MIRAVRRYTCESFYESFHESFHESDALSQM